MNDRITFRMIREKYITSKSMDINFSGECVAIAYESIDGTISIKIKAILPEEKRKMSNCVWYWKSLAKTFFSFAEVKNYISNHRAEWKTHFRLVLDEIDRLNEEKRGKSE